VKVGQLVNKCHAFHGNWRLITMLTKACHWAKHWDSKIQSTTSYFISLWLILTLSSHLHLRLPSGHLPSCFLTKVCVHFSSLQTCHTLCPSHTPWLTILILFGEGQKSMKFFIKQLFASTCYFLPLRSKYSPQQLIVKHTQLMVFSLQAKFHAHIKQHIKL
jgi:hypothetical protein